jgi:hypothetical protein
MPHSSSRRRTEPTGDARAEIINAALSDCRIEALPGQQHVAHLVAPELPADRIVSFLS